MLYCRTEEQSRRVFGEYYILHATKKKFEFWGGKRVTPNIPPIIVGIYYFTSGKQRSLLKTSSTGGIHRSTDASGMYLACYHTKYPTHRLQPVVFGRIISTPHNPQTRPRKTVASYGGGGGGLQGPGGTQTCLSLFQACCFRTFGASKIQ